MYFKPYEDHLSFSAGACVVIGGRAIGALRVMQITACVFILSDDRGRRRIENKVKCSPTHASVS